MKLAIFQVFVVLGFLTATAQYGPQQIISPSAHGAFRAIPHDMNNDGFMDVVAAAYSDSKIAWYLNIDGEGNFSAEHIITESAVTVEAMELYDLDSDGDMDVLYKTLFLDKIAWLENLDGMGNFGTERIIADINYPYQLHASDLDGDGDIDVLAKLFNSVFNQRLVWYENIDGLGTFSTEILIDIVGIDQGNMTLTTFDLDNDGDLDIITSGGDGAVTLVWYENDGLGTFTAEQELFRFSEVVQQILYITPSDLNGDGKTDLLIDTSHDDFPDYIYWLENLDGQGSFGTPQFIHEKETSLGSLRSYDLDGDDDLDVLVSFFFEGSSISWFENTDGQGDFGPKHIISTLVIRATDGTAADLNGDGDLDVISASWFHAKIAWYEYLEPLGISDNNYSRVVLYPNPTQGLVTLFSDQTITKIELLNSLGQNIDLTWDTSQIDLSKLESGIYFLRIQDHNGFSEIHKIIKK